MKKKYYMFTILLIAMACSEPVKWKDQITNSEMIALYGISRNPTDPADQNPDKVYCQDYEILKSVSLTPEQVVLLKASLINQDNYSKEDLKRCPFMPEYALSIDSSLAIIIGMKPCARIWFKNEINGKEKLMDLVRENEIEKILNQIVNQ